MEVLLGFDLIWNMVGRFLFALHNVFKDFEIIVTMK